MTNVAGEQVRRKPQGLGLIKGALSMFDGVWVPDRSFDEPQVTAILPWQFVALLLGFLALSVILAILNPNVFGAPFKQF
jgi:hypothetical protein